MTTRDREPLLLLAAVRSALVALDAADSTAHPPVEIDVLRIERYLVAALVLHPDEAITDGAHAVKSACRHLRRGELLEAYTALHAAHLALDGGAQ